jgi:hypothetical protein
MKTWVGVDILVDADEETAREHLKKLFTTMGYEVCPDETRIVVAHPDAITGAGELRSPL